MSANARIRTATATAGGIAATMIFSGRKRTDARKTRRQKFWYVPRKTAVIPSDVEGSYTGMPMTNEQFSDPEQAPVQDADDL